MLQESFERWSIPSGRQDILRAGFQEREVRWEGAERERSGETQGWTAQTALCEGPPLCSVPTGPTGLVLCCLLPAPTPAAPGVVSSCSSFPGWWGQLSSEEGQEVVSGMSPLYGRGEATCFWLGRTLVRGSRAYLLFPEPQVEFSGMLIKLIVALLLYSLSNWVSMSEDPELCSCA